MPEMTLTLDPTEVTRSVDGTDEERRFTIEATIESTYGVKDDDHLVEFSADPTGIISDAWISTSGESGTSFDYPNVESIFDSPGSSSFSVEYECLEPGETEITAKLSSEGEGSSSGNFYEEDTATVSVTCEPGEDPEECNESHSLYGSAVTVALLLQIQMNVFCTNLTPLQILYILHSALSIGQKDVANDHTTFVAFWIALQYYNLAMLNTMFNNSDFDCGEGDNGYTICPAVVNDLAEGDYVVVSAIVEEDIPLDDPDNIYQYGFVFDSDGDTGNNYTPHPDYPNDFFADTDLWFTANYTPGGGWVLTANDATNSVITEIATDARIIIRDNSMFLVVPASEFAVSDPAFRITAFRHTGDYGMNPPNDWDGSIWPAVEDGLEEFPAD